MRCVDLDHVPADDWLCPECVRNDLHLIKSVHTKRTRENKVEYLVRWVGYGSVETWQAFQDIPAGSRPLVDKFNASLRSKAPAAPSQPSSTHRGKAPAAPSQPSSTQPLSSASVRPSSASTAPHSSAVRSSSAGSSSSVSASRGAGDGPVVNGVFDNFAFVPPKAPAGGRKGESSNKRNRDEEMEEEFRFSSREEQEADERAKVEWYAARGRVPPRKKPRQLSPLAQRRTNGEAALARLELERQETSPYHFNCLAFSCMMASGQLEMSLEAQSAAEHRSDEERRATHEAVGEALPSLADGAIRGANDVWWVGHNRASILKIYDEQGFMNEVHVHGFATRLQREIVVIDERIDVLAIHHYMPGYHVQQQIAMRRALEIRKGQKQPLWILMSQGHWSALKPI